jgi:hypothetical protein
MPAHSFQAPTLIGCQIFKEQGTRLLNYEFCTAFLLLPDISLSRFVSEAENEIMKDFFDTVKLTSGFSYNLMTIRQRHEEKFKKHSQHIRVSQTS